ncbi:hypothetical protein Clacol_001068 [Clathrus columnatus]|uniref:Protein kinase domain-containing protein n=1 Tax=Clathrus columnatus TaxID=1419009 RepID=A0AAV4ZXM2_9AGAM|nr:hypothetical protein Clacol_001068 [Clathrus columnatus]
MRHRFVVIKLRPRLPPWARVGQKVLPFVNTTPFLALHLLYPREQREYRIRCRTSNLFVISSEKPTSPNSEYFVLTNKKKTKRERTNKADTRTLTVDPPLPFKETLYLSVTPRICAEFKNSRAHGQLINGEKYRLDKASSKRFLQVLEGAGPSIPGVCETAGEEEAVPALSLTNSHTWSGYSRCQGDRARISNWEVQFDFDLLPFKSLSEADLKTGSIYDELNLLRQVNLDYTWENCDNVTKYIQSAREDLPLLATSGQLIRVPSAVSTTQQPDPSANILRPSFSHLQSLVIPFDGDPVDESEMDDEWSDEPMTVDSDYDLGPVKRVSPIPAVKADDIRMIVFDPNVLVDHDGPLQETLMSIFPPSVYQFTAKELLDLYVEREALRVADGHLVSPTAVIQDIAFHLDLPIKESTIADALKHHAEPHLYPEVSATLAALIDEGYILILLNSSSHNPQMPIPRLPTLTSCSLESLCTQSHPTLRRSQILIITNDNYHIAEPASVAGFPTALVQRPGSRSAELVIPSTPTTYTFPTLNELLTILKDPASAPKPFKPFNPKTQGEVIVIYSRIQDCYQVTAMLGTGSYGLVFDAIQLNTGSRVAVKSSFWHVVLSYEAAIYAQLKGVSGLPRVHWHGPQRGGQYIMVMDKLGPTLAHLKNFCRGRFSLKTILMLGDQMLSIIEAVHSRGIIVRDIKPENFAMGHGKDYNRLFLFDFDFSKLWFDPHTASKHIPFREGRMQIGMERYMSRNAHSGFEQSRRDDIESIGYVLLYLLHGRLPWQGIGASYMSTKLRRMQKMKLGKPFIDFLAHEKTPKFFNTFFEHSQSLAFEEQPDYNMLRNLFRTEFEERGWGKEYDWEFDWWKKSGVDEEIAQPLAFVPYFERECLDVICRQEKTQWFHERAHDMGIYMVVIHTVKE